MALTDMFVKKVKSTREGGQKYADDGGMYLLVTPVGKDWRFDYRFHGKRND